MPRLGFLTNKGVPVPEEAIRRMPARDIETLFSLPAPIVLAALGPEREPYEDHQVALSSLMQTDVRQPVLKRRHGYWERPMDMYWALSSTYGMHAQLEGAAIEGWQELKVQVTVNGLEVRGRVDDYCDHRVTDWKETSAWGWKDLQKDGLALAKPNDLRQVQGYIALIPHILPNECPTAGRLVYKWRDWSASSAKRYSSGYPKEPIHVENLTPEQADWNACDRLLQEAVATWQKAMQTADDDLPECQTLYRPDKETGLPTRCLKYCPVSDKCNQYKRIRAEKGFSV